MITRPYRLLVGISICLTTRAAFAEEAKLVFVVVPAETSGLTHEINSELERGELKYMWMSPPVDLDGDGRLDVIVYGHHGGGAAVWLNQGGRKFALDKEPYQARWPFGGRDPIWWQFTIGKPAWGLGTEGTGIAGRLFRNDDSGHFEATSLQRLHVGVGEEQAVDVRVRFPSGTVREIRGAKVGDDVVVRE